MRMGGAMGLRLPVTIPGKTGGVAGNGYSRPALSLLKKGRQGFHGLADMPRGLGQNVIWGIAATQMMDQLGGVFGDRLQLAGSCHFFGQDLTCIHFTCLPMVEKRHHASNSANHRTYD
jgi:hypothetical protein